MTEAKKRKVHTPEFKAKVGLEALQGMKTPPCANMKCDDRLVWCRYQHPALPAKWLIKNIFEIPYGVITG